MKHEVIPPSSTQPSRWPLQRKLLVCGLFLGIGSIGILTPQVLGPDVPHRPQMPEPITTEEAKAMFQKNPHEFFFGGHHGTNPFVCGKTWVMGRPKAGKPVDMAFRMDVDTGEVDWICSKETQWGLPVFLPEKNRILCMVRTPGLGTSVIPLAKRLGSVALDHSLQFDAVNTAKAGVRLDFWMQGDLPGSLIYMGTGHETTSPSSYADPSPNGTYCRIHTSGGEHLMFDLAKKKRIELPPSVHGTGGWWGEDMYLYLTPTGDLGGYDLKAHESRTLFTSEQIKAFFREQGTRVKEEIHNSDYYMEIGTGGDPSHPGVFLALGEVNKVQDQTAIAAGWPVAQTITLLAIDPVKVELRLASKTPHRSYQHFDGTGTKAVFGGKDGGITVYDATTGATTSLLPTRAGGGYSNPAFYKDRILFNENGLGAIKLDGAGERTRLFPLPR